MSVTAAELYQVLRRVRPLHQLSARAVTAGLEGTGVTLGMRAVLEQLHVAGPQTVPAVGRALFLPRQVIQRLVDDAAGLGLVELRPNPAHRRSRLVALTDAGRRTFDDVHAGELARLGVIADDVAPADLAACLRVLDRLVDGVRGAPDPAAPGGDA